MAGRTVNISRMIEARGWLGILKQQNKENTSFSPRLKNLAKRERRSKTMSTHSAVGTIAKSVAFYPAF